MIRICVTVLGLLGGALIVILGDEALARVFAFPIERAVKDAQGTADVVGGDF